MTRAEAAKILGISVTSDEATINSAYRRLAMEHHPDNGGEAETFNRIVQAVKVMRTKPSRSSMVAEIRSIYGKRVDVQ